MKNLILIFSSVFLVYKSLKDNFKFIWTSKEKSGKFTPAKTVSKLERGD